MSLDPAAINVNFPLVQSLKQPPSWDKLEFGFEYDKTNPEVRFVNSLFTASYQIPDFPPQWQKPIDTPERKLIVKCMARSDFHAPLYFCSLEQASVSHFVTFREVSKIYALALGAFAQLKGKYSYLKYGSNIQPFDPKSILIDFSNPELLTVHLLFSRFESKQSQAFFKKNNVNAQSREWARYGPSHRIKNFVLELSENHRQMTDDFFDKVTQNLIFYKAGSELTPGKLKHILMGDDHVTVSDHNVARYTLPADQKGPALD